MYNIQRHLAYNDWANNKLTEILSSVEPSLIDAETPSSFNTVRKTVYHVWDAQEIWFTRLKGNEISEWPSQLFTGSFEEGLQQFSASSKALHDFIAEQRSRFSRHKHSLQKHERNCLCATRRRHSFSPSKSWNISPWASSNYVAHIGAHQFSKHRFDCIHALATSVATAITNQFY
jgi:hypothetical protein